MEDITNQKGLRALGNSSSCKVWRYVDSPMIEWNYCMVLIHTACWLLLLCMMHLVYYFETLGVFSVPFDSFIITQPAKPSIHSYEGRSRCFETKSLQ